MKKINLLLIALVAVLAMGYFVACSDDDDDVISDNMTLYQSIVNAEVESNKSSDKAILLVAFGSTWQQAFESFDATVTAYKKAYSGYDIYISFSSVICRNNAASGVHEYENTEIRNYYSPENYLRAFANSGYTTIVVQSLQVIPGEEYSRVINDIKDFSNNQYNDIDEDYLASIDIYLGVPLMAAEEDVTNLAEAINTNLGSVAESNIVALMGHGNPNEYDTYSANVRYTQLEEALQEINANYYVGTVDMPDNLIDDVLERMTEAGLTSGNVECYPLMSIAGDHAHNDLVEDWGGAFEDAGYTCAQTMIGLLDYDNILQLWMNHTDDAIAGDPLEYNKAEEE